MQTQTEINAILAISEQLGPQAPAVSAVETLADGRWSVGARTQVEQARDAMDAQGNVDGCIALDRFLGIYG